MLEIAPGVYTAPDMSPAVRDRLWEVLADWWDEWPETSLVMTWEAPAEPGGQGVRCLGQPPRELVETESVILMRRSDADPSRSN